MACRASLVVGFLDIWWADEGEAFPDVDSAPGGNWNKIGQLGARDYTEDGITITADVETAEINSLESIDPECMILTGRNMRVSVTIHDLSLAQVRAGFGFNAVSDLATPHRKELDLEVSSLPEKAIILRGTSKSPEEEGAFNLQFQFAKCVEIGSKEITFTKGGAAGVQLEFRVLAGEKKMIAGTSS